MGLIDLENFFNEFLLEEVRHLDFQMLDDETFQSIRSWIEKCSDPKKKMSLSLGGRIPVEYLAQECEVLSFIKANQLDQKFLALRRQLSFDSDRGPAIPVVLSANSFTEVYWDELYKQVNEKSIRFFYKNTIAFQTDKNLQLVSPFSVMSSGIMQYDPLKSSAIFPVEKSVSENNESWIELWTKEESAFLVLRSYRGSVYAIGVEEDHLISPPAEYFHRWSGFKRIREEITEEQLKGILKQIERDKYFWKVKRGKEYLFNICAPFEMK